LIFGVADAGTITGTRYRMEPGSLDSLKHEIANHVSNNLTFVAIYSIDHPAGKRVLLFQIPAALKGMPTGWKGHYFGRDGESLVALNLEEIERIRNQAAEADWTAVICPDATVEDLSPEAIMRAREEYGKRNPRLADEMHQWDDVAFLNKAMLTIKGQITRAAIILLGRPEVEVFLSPSVATISWILKDEKGNERDYEHFAPPWILNVNAIYGKIRNLRYRHMPDGTLFPLEVNQYDEWVFREALHNAIAHQDYSLRERISVVEFPDHLLFYNAGYFIPRSIEEVIARDAPATCYRNPFLTRASGFSLFPITIWKVGAFPLQFWVASSILAMWNSLPTTWTSTSRKSCF
jgi:ATP-dependent DNA helicase RecG